MYNYKLFLYSQTAICICSFSCKFWINEGGGEEQELKMMDKFLGGQELDRTLKKEAKLQNSENHQSLISFTFQWMPGTTLFRRLFIVESSETANTLCLVFWPLSCFLLQLNSKTKPNQTKSHWKILTRFCGFKTVMGSHGFFWRVGALGGLRSLKHHWKWSWWPHSDEMGK